ncbi:MAG: hypothetical protein SGCHY_003412 [Lobulomycetales sp.]
MPALSPTMTQGNLGSWSKAIGDEVQPGDVLVEIETDKAQMDFECQDDGFLASILVKSGTQEVVVNQPIGVLCENKDDVAAFADFKLSDVVTSAEESATESPAAAPVPTESSAPSPSSPASSASSSSESSRVFASPLAKNMAASKGFNLQDIPGSGPNSRIVKSDVDTFVPTSAAAPAPTTAPASKPAAAPPMDSGAAFQDTPISGIRKVIAERLTLSKSTIPHYYLSSDVKMDKIIKLRAALNDQAAGEFKLSLNDFIVKACALALKDVPQVNCSWQDSFIREYQNADIAVAVATDNGLITPIVRNAQGKGVKAISMEVKDMAMRARKGGLAPHEYQGGTFTISNLGMYGITSFSAIVNPPHSAILAVGSARDELKLGKDGEVTVCKTVSVTGSFDHRTVDGAVGAQFMSRVVAYLEDPMKMLL